MSNAPRAVNGYARRLMIGIELSPAVALVGQRSRVMFQAIAPASAQVVGLLVGARYAARRGEIWKPAIDHVTVELVAIHGIVLGGGRALLPERDGWRFNGSMRVGDTIAVCIRNDQRRALDVRCVLAVDGQGRKPRDRLLDF